ncbi:GbsR/MarR family transcriptional regulator [Myroides sp. LJL119]
MQKIDPEILQLFQDYCSHYELVYRFSPLTAQVYTYITFVNNKDGVTFDELVEKLNTSKSSVSTSIHLLLSSNLIEQFNKIDERKRFFRLNQDYVTKRLTMIRDILIKEKELGTKLRNLQDRGLVNTQCCKATNDLYLEHLEKSKIQLTQTIEKLKSTN